MNVERLTMLADYLDGVGQFEGRGAPKNKFDLELWHAPYTHFSKEFDIKGNPKKKPFKTKTIKIAGRKYTIAQPNECQTAGCAIGWAATIPEFVEQGLFLIRPSYTGQTYPAYVINDYEYTRFTAIETFFDISGTEATTLFVDTYYTLKDSRDPKAVAKRIRSLMKVKTDTQRRNWIKKWFRTRS